MLYYTTAFNSTYQTRSNRNTPQHVMSCHATIPHYTIAYHAIPHQTTPHHTTPCHAMPCLVLHVTPRHTTHHTTQYPTPPHNATPHPTIPSHAMQECMPYHKMLYHVASIITFYTISTRNFLFVFFSMVYSRGQFHHWCFQVKIKAAANVSYVTDEMMHACGGAGYKKELGRSVQRSNQARNNRHT